ncbi:MAG TPA: hypothetical protein VL280_06160 [Burkholderiales bacterium]|jgi:hypothetical protein|nr:hypothetical protein [Burkholderiales bacterium]
MRVLRIALYMGLMGVLGWFLAALAIPAAIGWELSEAGVHALPIYGFLAGLALGLCMALVVAVRDTWRAAGAVGVRGSRVCNPVRSETRPARALAAAQVFLSVSRR